MEGGLMRLRRRGHDLSQRLQCAAAAGLRPDGAARLPGEELGHLLLYLEQPLLGPIVDEAETVEIARAGAAAEPDAAAGHDKLVHRLPTPVRQRANTDAISAKPRAPALPHTSMQSRHDHPAGFIGASV
jgi:hypothetical protein